ncbi:alpha-glucoside-specific PTS transporter subunit IIBC [Lacticigenium naphthae]|uniref:alpha-glucoside-specific PTS transporter subunit IIBC n=1 Tax=Lacticigenium naphthae TaxID=515351 RepID=UPI0003FEB967|nr:alpha-glucoside-specific PTS transporter subunit IIBC [Lacticigenium naphthae]
MMEKIQRFGGAMFTPVLLFAFNGIVLSLAIAMQTELIVGGIAADGSLWSQVWAIIESGGWTIFSNIELLFVIGLPIGLAKKANARAALAAFVVYMTWNNFMAKMLEFWGSSFGVDYSLEAGGVSGLKNIGGVKTLDTNLIGAILIAAIVVWIHNRFFEKKLPEWLGIFQGSSMVVIIGFILMFPLALLTAWGWPAVQNVISGLQTFMANSGAFGVGIYVFLERILIPTGLHHFIYQPFIYGPAVIEGGIEPYWLENLNYFANTPGTLRSLFPEGGFALHNVSKMFAPIGIGAALVVTAKKDKQKQTLALIIPTALTAILAGITEPFEFTFLFLAPQLFAVHAVLAGLLGATLYMFGVSGDIGSGLLTVVTKFIVPMWSNHLDAILLVFGIGLAFSVIYFIIFRYAILKWDIQTPGRAGDSMKMYRKADYKAKKAGELVAGSKTTTEENPYKERAVVFLEGLGGSDNIADITNCATRLRVSVKDAAKVKEADFFTQGGAHGLVEKGKAFQVIVGLDVPQVRENFEKLVTIE